MKRAVVMLITNGFGQVLLLKRSPDCKKFPGEWCLPGGKVDYITHKINTISYEKKVEAWEGSDTAAYRETLEETGIDVVVFKNTGVIMGDPEFTVEVFESLLNFEASDVTREFPNREHVEFGFFNPYNLPDEIGKRTKVILMNTIFKEQ